MPDSRPIQDAGRGRLRPASSRDAGRRFGLAVAEQEESPASLRNAVIGRVQHMLRKPVSRTAESSQELPVAGPGPHLDHVLDHDPPGRDGAGVPHDLECEIAAPVRARARSAGATVVRALRRCQEKVDPAHLLDDSARLLLLDGRRTDLSRGEVVGEDLDGQIPGIDAAHDRRAGRCRTVAASAQPAEDVVGPDHRPSRPAGWREVTRFRTVRPGFPSDPLRRARGAEEDDQAIQERIVRLDLALPGDEDPPSIAREPFLNALVPGDVGGELRLPELLAGLGGIGLPAAVPVPEAPVYEDRLPTFGKNDVGPARKAADVDAKPIAQGMKRSPHEELRLRIPTPDAAHENASLQRCQNVGHRSPPSARSGSADSTRTRHNPGTTSVWRPRERRRERHGHTLTEEPAVIPGLPARAHAQPRQRAGGGRRHQGDGMRGVGGVGRQPFC